MNKNWHDVLLLCGQPVTGDNFAVKDWQLDSREILPGDVFVAVAGETAHGSAFVEHALQQGAVAILSDRQLDCLPVPVVVLEDLLERLGELAHCYYGMPSEHLGVLAVTGTNGKTSVAWFLVQGLKVKGIKAAYIGTLGAGLINDLRPIGNTTPSVLTVHRLLSKFVELGVQYVAMEVSSHALTQGRINGVRCQHSLYTNLSRDHLDYHHSMADYEGAKKRLFTDFSCALAVVNADDEVGRSWLVDGINAKQVESCGVDYVADWRATDVVYEIDGLRFNLQYKSNSVPVKCFLMGRFNVENLLLVAASLHGLGITLAELSDVLSQLPTVPGRMDMLFDEEKSITWVVDYAHTPEALNSVLAAIRAHVKGRLWCVFGCGGDRDHGKRTLMGQAAVQGADKVVVTSDNPRTEPSETIIEDIINGIKLKVKVIVDRKQAIQWTAGQSVKGDVILVAGKGHEDYQEINGVKYPFNDARIIKQIMEQAA